MDIVLDSYSLIAFFDNETGADKVGEILKQANNKQRFLYLSVVNWGEVYYVSFRKNGKGVADDTMRNIESLPIEIVPVDREITQVAAELKANYRMSYADTFAAALAMQKKAQLVTGDREFKQVEHDIKIIWL